jgi:DNA-binding MarR family transcriptional regulator
MDDVALAEDLRRTIGELVRVVRRADTMPPGEAAALGYLDRLGPQTTADLAQRRRVTHQSAAKSVKDLLDQGLVRAEPHPVDGRKLLLHITDEGRSRLQAERGLRAGFLGGALRDELDEDERRRLQDCVPLLARLTARLAASTARPARGPEDED